MTDMLSYYLCSLGLTLCTLLGLIIRTGLSAKLIKLLKLCGVAPRLLALQLRFGLCHLFFFFFIDSIIFFFFNLSLCVFCRFLPTLFLLIIVLQEVFILKSMMTLFPYRYLHFTIKFKT